MLQVSFIKNVSLLIGRWSRGSRVRQAINNGTDKTAHQLITVIIVLYKDSIIQHYIHTFDISTFTIFYVSLLA